MSSFRLPTTSLRLSISTVRRLSGSRNVYQQTSPRLTRVSPNRQHPNPGHRRHLRIHLGVAVHPYRRQHHAPPPPLSVGPIAPVPAEPDARQEVEGRWRSKVATSKLVYPGARSRASNCKFRENGAPNQLTWPLSAPPAKVESHIPAATASPTQTPAHPTIP